MTAPVVGVAPRAPTAAIPLVVVDVNASMAARTIAARVRRSIAATCASRLNAVGVDNTPTRTVADTAGGLLDRCPWTRRNRGIVMGQWPVGGPSTGSPSAPTTAPAGDSRNCAYPRIASSRSAPVARRSRSGRGRGQTSAIGRPGPADVGRWPPPFSRPNLVPGRIVRPRPSACWAATSAGAASNGDVGGLSGITTPSNPRASSSADWSDVGPTDTAMARSSNAMAASVSSGVDVIAQVTGSRFGASRYSSCDVGKPNTSRSA